MSTTTRNFLGARRNLRLRTSAACLSPWLAAFCLITLLLDNTAVAQASVPPRSLHPLIPSRPGMAAVARPSALAGSVSPFFETWRRHRQELSNRLVQGAATISGWSAGGMPTARSGAQTLSDAYGDIFVIGGEIRGGGPFTDFVEGFEPAQNTWLCSWDDVNCPTANRMLQPLPTPRMEMAGAAVSVQIPNPRNPLGGAVPDTLLFLMGGLDASGHVSSIVEVYDVVLNQWYCSTNDPGVCASKLLPALPTARAYATAATGPNDNVYLMGGLDSSGTVRTLVEAYDPFSNAWTCSQGDASCPAANQSLQPLPQPRMSMGTAMAANGLIYVIGGGDAMLTPQNTTYTYDVNTNQWSSGPSLNTARAFLAAAAGPDGQLYAIGGGQGPTMLNSVESYNPNLAAFGAAWTVLNTPLPSACADFGAASSNNGQLFAMCGQVDPATQLPSYYAYTPPPAAPQSQTLVQQLSYPSTALPPAQFALIRGALYNGHPTNAIFGNYTYQHTDLQMPGYGPPVRIARTYSSLYPQPGIFGYGWNVTFGMRITVGPSSVQLTREDGRVDTYPLQNGAIMTPQGWADTLTRNADGSFTLSTREHLIYQFTSTGALSSVRDADGNTVTLSYTGSLWTGLRDAAGRAWTLTYNSGGHVASVSDPAGRTVSYTYDNNGNLTAVTDPAGGVTQLSYDAQHQLDTITDANGHLVVQNVYTLYQDGYSRVTAQSDSRGWRYFYYFSNATAYVDPMGAVTFTFYDQYNNPIYRVDPLGRATAYTYNYYYGSSGNYLYGLLASTIDPAGNVTTYGYDNPSQNNISQITDPLGNVTRLIYDGNNNLLSRTDPLNHTTGYTYNGANHPLTMTDALGHTTNYGYDGRGLQTSVTDPLGNTTSYTYDGNGNQTAVTDPLGHTTTYTYDSAGRVIAQADPLGHTTRTAYNALNLPITLTAADGGVTTYTYDAAGNRLTTTDPLGHTTTDTYDQANDLVGETDALHGTTSYIYDFDGRQIARILPDGSAWSQTYDAAGEKVSATSPLCNANSACQADPITYCELNPNDCHTTQYAYDVNGNLQMTLDPAGRIRFNFYDADNRLQYVFDPLLNVTQYTYDAAGNRTAVTDALNHTTTYSYDALNRPLSVTNALGQTSNTTYDADGRISSTTNGAGQTIANTYDAAGHLIQVVAGSSTTSYTYDAAGNRATMQDGQGITTYSYDAMNRATSIASPHGQVSYTYDLAGNRASLSQPSAPSTAHLSADTVRQANTPPPVANAPSGAQSRSMPAQGDQTSASSPALSAMPLPFAHRPSSGDLPATMLAVRALVTRPAHGPIAHARVAAAPAPHAPAAPTNDNFARALAITRLPRRLRETTGAATMQAGEPRPSCAAAVATVWFRVKPSRAGTLTVDTSSSNYDTGLAAYVGRTLHTLRQVTCYSHKSTVSRQARLRLSVKRGVTYYIQVSSVRSGRRAAHTPAHVLVLSLSDVVPARHTSSGGKSVGQAHATPTKQSTPIPPATATPTAPPAAPPPTNTAPPQPAPTFTTPAEPAATSTPLPPATNTPAATTPPAAVPTNTNTPLPLSTATSTPLSSATATPVPANSTVTSTYQYDADNRLVAVQSGGSMVVQYGYDSAGRNTSRTFANGITTLLAYDSEGRITDTVTSKGSTTWQQSTYSYDNVGNRITESSSGFGAAYTYDDLNQLTHVDSIFVPSGTPAQCPGSSPQCHSYSYSYDAVGNLTSATVDGTSIAYTYNAADQLTSAGGTAIAYDAAGRMTSDGQSTYSYDAFDHLTSISGATTASYGYDGDGNRIAETINGVSSTYLLDTAAPLPARIAATSSAGQTRYVYGLQRALDVAPNGSQQYEHADALDSVRLLTDANGNALSYDWYNPTGSLLQPGSGGGAFGFTGEPSTANGSLIYLRARDYSPTLDRFLTTDPHAPNPLEPQTYNPYMYAGNDPTTFTDHTGQQCMTGFEPDCFSAGNPYGAAVGAFNSLGQLASPLGANTGTALPLISQLWNDPSGSLAALGNLSATSSSLDINSLLGFTMGDQGNGFNQEVGSLLSQSVGYSTWNASNGVLSVAATYGPPGVSEAATQLTNNCGGNGLTAGGLDNVNCLVNELGFPGVQQVNSMGTSYNTPDALSAPSWPGLNTGVQGSGLGSLADNWYNNYNQPILQDWQMLENGFPSNESGFGLGSW